MIEHEQIPKEKKVGFTSGQREFVKRAYREVLGFDGCVFPIWDEDEGEYRYCKALKTEIHHLKPRGWCIRVLDVDPNVPFNAAPLCAEHHRVGQKDKPITREAQEVIHLDAVFALRHYQGTEKPTSFDRVFDQRKRLTDKLTRYWFWLWDIYLQDLADEVMGEYLQDHEWPKRR